MDTLKQSPQAPLTNGQLQRIERNRQRAIVLKKSHLMPHPYTRNSEAVSYEKSVINIGGMKYKDTGGGFLLEEEADKSGTSWEPVVEEEPPIIDDNSPTCMQCNKTFASSWLLTTFDHGVCDECKDSETHKLITKTEAVKEYLLKDGDLDRRQPPLKYITRKNPHNSHWGDMKLYLRLQVEERALMVWGSMEKIEEEREQRDEKRVIAKTKKYNKEMKQLRMNVRSSLYNKTSSASHTHSFGPESYNEDDDTYTHTCQTCNYEETFEKM